VTTLIGFAHQLNNKAREVGHPARHLFRVFESELLSGLFGGRIFVQVIDILKDLQALLLPLSIKRVFTLVHNIGRIDIFR